MRSRASAGGWVGGGGGGGPGDAGVALARRLGGVRRTRRPGESGIVDRIRMCFAITVAQTRALEQACYRPCKCIRNLGASATRRLGPVVMRRRVEVACQEDRCAFRRKSSQRRERRRLHHAARLL